MKTEELTDSIFEALIEHPKFSCVVSKNNDGLDIHTMKDGSVDKIFNVKIAEREK